MCYYIIVTRKWHSRKEKTMENEGMTNEQFNKVLEMLLHILENEDKERAIQLIELLLKKEN